MKNSKHWLGLCLLLTIVVLQDTSAETLQQMAAKVSRVPAAMITYIPNPSNPEVDTNLFATCFPLAIHKQKEELAWFFVANYHAFFIEDSAGRIVSQGERATIFRNAKDTIISLSAKLIAKDSKIDIAILIVEGEIPYQFQVERMAAILNLDMPHLPTLGERVIYSGFPKGLGFDKTFTQNSPLVIEGVVSQVKQGASTFLIQAPILGGASGSPIYSTDSGLFLGVVRGSVPGQESLLYAVRADELLKWLSPILETTPKVNSK